MSLTSIEKWILKAHREIAMSRLLMTLVCLLSALNVIALVLNLSQVSRAAVGGMSYQDLLRDPDFTRAVKSIAEQCMVNVDIARLKC
jgi:hypothetical protein